MRLSNMVQNNVELSIEELRKLAHFVHKETGVFLDDEKLKRFKKKIQNLLEQHNFNNFSNFYHQIRFARNPELIQELFNTITVNETYFWRENEQFEILIKNVLPKFINKSVQQMPRVRILVLPSSSGEELYSIMLALLDEDNIIHKANYELVGVDIDSRMIQKAKEGLYTKRSIEKLPKYLLEKYFHQEGKLYRIDEKLRRFPNFIQANIFDPQLPIKLGHFDVIFSRNMLIYFQQSEKKKAYEVLYSLLNDSGYLFLGHADANGIEKEKFEHFTNSFHVYRKK